MKKKNFVVSAVVIAVMLLAACSSSRAKSGTEQNTPSAGEASAKAAEPVVKTVPIPEKYQAELITRTGEEIEEEDTIIAVFEKASVEANKALDEDLQYDYAGWLFSIGTLNETEYHDMLCGDMSFAKVFAKDANDTYYVFYHPTDVNMVRKSDKYTEDELNHWSELTKWADSVPKTLMEENSSLTAVTYDNSEVTMMLNRAAYAEDEVYSISTAKDGERKPDEKDAAAPFVDRLTREATITTAKTKEKPEGEYISISFPDYQTRFDFYPAEGKKNYIRQVYVVEEEEGKFEEIEGEGFVAEFADGKTSAADIMQEWYDSLK